MARFVSRYYQTSSIAANDIGAIDYMANLHLVDLTGLAFEPFAFQDRRANCSWNVAMTRFGHEQLVELST